MPLFTWDESYSVQVAEFDNQHKKLVAMINDLFDAMKQGKSKTILGSIFTDLVEYTKVHFAAEEIKMNQFHYPDTAPHTKEHRELTQKALELQAQFNAGTMLVSVDTLNFLRDWLRKHILETDKKYGAFFNSVGEK
jgi:hemerythrin